MTPDEAKALWPKVRAEVPAAYEDAFAMARNPPRHLRAMIEARYLAGCDEHAGGWTTRGARWCSSNADEESADLVTYLAFRRVLGRRRKVAT